jgi:hypothetical protein
MSINIMTSTYPMDQPSEQDWINEFNVGRRLHDVPNGFGMTFLEYIEHLKNNRSEEMSNIVWQNNF